MTEGLDSKGLTYHDATGLGERSTSTKHILGTVSDLFFNKSDKLLCSPTVARDCKSVMVAETKVYLGYEYAVQCQSRRCMHRGMLAPAASHAWINAEPT